MSNVFEQFNRSFEAFQLESQTVNKTLIPAIIEGYTISEESYSLLPNHLQPYYQPALETQLSAQENPNWIFDILKRIRDFAKLLWEKIIGFFQTVTRWFGSFGRKVEKTREILNDKEKVATAIKTNLVSKTKEYPDENEVTDELKRKGDIIAAAYGVPDFLRNPETMAQFRSRLNELSKTNRPVETMLPNVTYEITEQNFKYFGYNRNLKVLSGQQLDFQTSINSYYMKLALFAKNNLMAETLEKAVVSYCKGRTNTNKEEFSNYLADLLVKPFLDLDTLDVSGNISDTHQLVLKNTKKLKQNYDGASNKITAMIEVWKTFIPNITTADTKQKIAHFATKYDRPIMITYLSKLEKAINNLKANKTHLYDTDGKRLANGFNLEKRGLERLLRDCKIDPRTKTGIQIGKVILRVSQEMDNFISTAYANWMNVNKHQVRILNSRLNSIQNLITDIKE